MEPASPDKWVLWVLDRDRMTKAGEFETEVAAEEARSAVTVEMGVGLIEAPVGLCPTCGTVDKTTCSDGFHYQLSHGRVLR